MRTARLVRIEWSPWNRLCYADALLSDGSYAHGIGFAEEDDPSAKYQAMWDLVRVLNILNVEVE